MTVFGLGNVFASSRSGRLCSLGVCKSETYTLGIETRSLYADGHWISSTVVYGHHIRSSNYGVFLAFYTVKQFFFPPYYHYRVPRILRPSIYMIYRESFSIIIPHNASRRDGRHQENSWGVRAQPWQRACLVVWQWTPRSAVALHPSD